MYKNKWFPYLKENNYSKYRLFCFAHAGGSASVYAKWFDLNPLVEVIPIELPGHGTRMDEKSETDFNIITENIAKEIYTILNEKHVYFFGHSMGSILAFKTACLLKDKFKYKINKLFVSGRHAPQDADSSTYHSYMGMDELRKELIRIGNTSFDIINNPLYSNFFLPIVFHDYELHENYVYNHEVLDTPIVTLSGMNDYECGVDRMNRWKNITSSTFKQYSYFGNHFYLFNESSDEVKNTLLQEIR